MATDPQEPPDPSGGNQARSPRPGRRTDRVTARVVETRKRLDASKAGHVQRRLVQADLANQALILAALALTLLLPVLVTLAAVLPLGSPDSLTATVSLRLGLNAQATSDLQKLFPTRAAVRSASTVIGTMFTLLSAYTWPTALQRGYEIAWEVGSRGWRGLWRPLVWLTAFVGVGVALLAVPPIAGLAQPWRAVVLLLLGAPVVFVWSWWTQHFLLRGAVGWRPLLPGAVAMTIGLVALRAAATVFLSSGISYNYRHYGPLGIVFLILSWLVALSVVMLGGPVFGAALHEHRAQAAAVHSSAEPEPTEPIPLPRGDGSEDEPASRHPDAAPDGAAP